MILEVVDCYFKQKPVEDEKRCPYIAEVDGMDPRKVNQIEIPHCLLSC
jgi:hypothetical protein